jgi:hypothetical protein
VKRPLVRLHIDALITRDIDLDRDERPRMTKLPEPGKSKPVHAIHSFTEPVMRIEFSHT